MLKKLDLEKMIIIVSLVLLPVCGYWILGLRKQLELGQNALQAAIKPGGLIERIGTLENQLDKMQPKDGAGGASDFENPQLYFEKRIRESIQGIDNSQFTIARLQPRTITLRAGRKTSKVLDQEVQVKLVGADRKPTILTRKALNALVVNSEMHGSRVYKLRDVKISNAEIKPLRGKRDAPPVEVADNWIVDRLVFVRRQPVKPKASKKKKQ